MTMQADPSGFIVAIFGFVIVISFVLIFFQIAACPKGGIHIWILKDEDHWDIHHQYMAFKGLHELKIEGSPDRYCSKCGKFRHGSLWHRYQEMQREMETGKQTKG